MCIHQCCLDMSEICGYSLGLIARFVEWPGIQRLSRGINILTHKLQSYLSHCIPYGESIVPNVESEVTE